MAKRFELSESIERSPRQIHDWLADWDHVRAWMGPSLVSIEMLSQHADDAPMCAAMRFRETRKMGKMNAKANIEITRHDIDEQGVFRHEAVFDDGCNRMICQYRYTPQGDGTQASFAMHNAPNKLWTKAMCVLTGPMMLRMCAKHMGDHLTRLKQLIEAPR